jgi:membrane-bound inhibitor of C-type lysozyme
MTKNFLTIAMLTALFLSSCQNAPKQEKTGTATTETVGDDIVTTSSTDKDGKKLELTFNNTKGTATLNFNGETIELHAQKAASGIWYKNDLYELRGKGNDIELKKDGNLVFAHTDDIVTKSLKNKDGQTLDMTFNNTTNEAKIYLNGGEQIELVGQKPASGIWYKNDNYELRGKGDNVELTQDGKTVFKN